MVSNQPKTKRLFFAIYPDATARQVLGEIAKPLITTGVPSLIDNLHITLAFIGNSDLAYENCLIKKIKQICHLGSFTINIDQVGHFPKPRILWLGSQQPPAQLIKLHEALLEDIEPCGYQAENRPWIPHITIARKYRGNTGTYRLQTPVSICVDTFSLMESVSHPEGVRYVELKQFPLQTTIR